MNTDSRRLRKKPPSKIYIKKNSHQDTLQSIDQKSKTEF